MGLLNILESFYIIVTSDPLNCGCLVPSAWAAIFLLRGSDLMNEPEKILITVLAGGDGWQ